MKKTSIKKVIKIGKKIKEFNPTKNVFIGGCLGDENMIAIDFFDLGKKLRKKFDLKAQLLLMFIHSDN